MLGEVKVFEHTFAHRFKDCRRKFRIEVKLPTIRTDEKQRWEESAKRKEERRSKKRKSQKKEDPGVRKGRKVAIHCVFPIICGSGGSKSMRSHLARWEMKKCTSLWREAHFQVKTLKTPHVRSTFEVEMSKKCTPLWHEAHFEVKMYKTHHSRTTFGSWDVEKVHAVVAGSTFRSQNVKSTKVRTTCGRSDVVLRGMRKGLCTLSKVSKTWGFCSVFQLQPPLHHTTLQ